MTEPTGGARARGTREGVERRCCVVVCPPFLSLDGSAVLHVCRGARLYIFPKYRVYRRRFSIIYSNEFYEDYFEQTFPLASYTAYLRALEGSKLVDLLR